MPGPVEHRTVTPLLALLRDFFRGRSHTNPLRFADKLAARTQPPPDVPGGPYHKTTKVYYYSRDARREVEPPTTLFTGGKYLKIGENKDKEQPKLLHLTPGASYQWDK